VNNKFDELAKGLAQSVTRRQALKRFGVGLAGMAFACFGLANRAAGKPGGCFRAGDVCGRVPDIEKDCPRRCCSGFYYVLEFSDPPVGICS
jgi:hypothetical protein